MVDSPDRHGDPGDWLPRLEELAYDAGRPLAVVATVMSVPAGWTGPVAAIGNAASCSDGDLPPEDLPAGPLEVSTAPVSEDAK